MKLWKWWQAVLFSSFLSPAPSQACDTHHIGSMTAEMVPLVVNWESIVGSGICQMSSPLLWLGEGLGRGRLWVRFSFSGYKTFRVAFNGSWWWWVHLFRTVSVISNDFPGRKNEGGVGKLCSVLSCKMQRQAKSIVRNCEENAVEDTIRRRSFLALATTAGCCLRCRQLALLLWFSSGLCRHNSFLLNKFLE